MRKTLTIILPGLLALTAIDAVAGVVPYNEQAVQKITPSEYDKNNDSFITADEVEVELREDAIDKAIRMQKQGKSKAEIAKVIMEMEDSVEQDAEVIIDLMDKDGDELVEPSEIR